MKRPRFIFFIFVLVFCLLIQISHTQQIQYTQTQTTQQFPQSIINAMATRHMRYHHYMWHQVRANWNKFSSQTRNQFASIGWQPPNPARTSSDVSITNNYAGEDFLYMHRDMIRLARQAAISNGDSTAMLSSWLTIPAPNDPNYPVPPTYGYYSEYKTNGHYQNMKNEETYLKNYNNLRRMTLNQLGIQIENFIHTSLHYRWSGASSVGYRGGGIVTSNIPYIDKSWDTSRYDWMGDSYASHVNPHFWKLHGWIDDRVEDWRQANGLSSITWRGTWTGGPTSNLGSVVNKDMGGMHEMNSDPEAVGDVLMKAIDILANSGVPEAPLGAKTPVSSRQRRVIKTCKKKKRS